MTRPIATTDFTGQLIVLGCGTSVGVPSIGCSCPVCQSDDPRNQRTRCSIILGTPHGNLLIDTPPDLRSQLLREKIGIVHAVLYTHEHVDHLYGMDDLRLFQFYLGHAVPVYCTAVVEARIRHAFDYAFTDLEPTHAGSAPQIDFHRIQTAPFRALETEIVPIPMRHGPRFSTTGFRIGKIAYCTDTDFIPPASMDRLRNLDVLILGALRHKTHVSHFTLQQAIDIAQQLQPKRTIFTHMAHELDYAQTNASLPPNMELAYDGMRIPLT